MNLLDISINALGVLVGIAALAIGILTWWIGKLLDDKKNSTELKVRVENLERRVNAMEEDDRDARKKHR